MNRRIYIPSILVSTIILVLCDLWLTGDHHFEFTYGLLVLLSIWMHSRKITIQIGLMSSAIILVRYLINVRYLVAQTELTSVFIPLFFTWAFVYVVTLYKGELEKSKTTNERLTAMFRNATEGIIISNTKGEIVMINPHAELMFGYDKGELQNKQIEQLIPDRFGHKHFELRKKYYGEKDSRPMGNGGALFGRRKNKSELPLEISLSTFNINTDLYIISFIIDITERKKQEEAITKANEELETRVLQRTQELALTNKNLNNEIKDRLRVEDALRNSERLYNVMASHFPNGFICVINRSYRCVFIDGIELQDLGFTREQMEGTPIFDFPILPWDEVMKSQLSKVFDWKSSSFDTECNERIYSVNAVPLPDAKGFVNEILLVVQNATEMRTSEREIQDALKKERELNDLKSKFVSIASHEFRTPLSTILSSVTLIEKYDQPVDVEKKTKHIERIKSSVKNLTEILNDFLSLEKLEAGKVELNPSGFDLVAFSKDLCEEMQIMARPGQQIVYHHEGEYKKAVLDKQLLRNACINLLNNAIKYSPDATPVEFTTSCNGEIVISIKDHGLGIPVEDQQHLFERFFRARNVTAIQGTGLGLNIVNRYIKLMNGSMNYHSAENIGSEFIIRFPQTISHES